LIVEVKKRNHSLLFEIFINLFKKYYYSLTVFEFTPYKIYIFHKRKISNNKMDIDIFIGSQEMVFYEMDTTD